MTNTEIEHKLFDGLIEILSILRNTADEINVDKELPKITIDYFWMQKDGKGNGQGKRAQALVPLLYKADSLLDKLIEADKNLANKVNEFGEIAISIVTNDSFPAFIAPNFGKDTLSIAKLIISEYIREAGGLKVRKTVVKKVSKDFVSDISSNTYSSAFVFLVQNFKAPRPFQLNLNIKFRPISEDDYKQFSTIEPGRIPSHKEPWFGSDDWICTIESSGDKSSTAAINSHRDILDLITGALALTSTGRANFFFLLGRYKSRFFNVMSAHGGDYVHSSGIGGAIVLDEKGIRNFRTSFNLVESIFTNPKYKSLRLPFRRLRLSSTRANDNDKFVDYVIGLERLLSSDSPNLEVTFRFRLRGAALLPESFGSEQDRLSLMSKLYRIRSDIVHGGEHVEEVRDIIEKTEQVFVAIFINYFHLLSAHENDKQLTERLDEALVKGGLAFRKNVKV